MADGNGATTRKVMTLDALKALKGAARYDAMREVIETGGDIEEECTNDVFRRLCIRRTWPKKRGDGVVAEFGRANRWNFKPYDDPTSKEESMFPPSRSASSPDALYRLLHVVEPFRLVTRGDKGDYYKGSIFRFYSHDRRYLCWVGFHKHELNLSFYCPPEDLFIPQRPAWPDELRAEPQTREEAATWWEPETGGWHKHVEKHRDAFDAHSAAERAYETQGVIVPWCSERMRCKNPDGQAWMRLVVAVANTPWLIYGGNNFRV